MRLSREEPVSPPPAAGSDLPIGAVVVSVLLGAAVFLVGFVVLVAIMGAAVLSQADQPDAMEIAGSPVVDAAAFLITLIVSLASAYIVGRRLPDAVAGGPRGLMIAGGTPLSTWLVFIALTITSSPEVVATVLQSIALLTGSGIGAWRGQLANSAMAGPP